MILDHLVHKMKGGVVYCGAPKMKFACQYLERYYKAGHTAMLERLYHQFIAVTEDTEREIKEWLRKQSS